MFILKLWVICILGWWHISSFLSCNESMCEAWALKQIHCMIKESDVFPVFSWQECAVTHLLQGFMSCAFRSFSVNRCLCGKIPLRQLWVLGAEKPIWEPVYLPFWNIQTSPSGTNNHSRFQRHLKPLPCSSWCSVWAAAVWLITSVLTSSSTLC